MLASLFNHVYRTAYTLVKVATRQANTETDIVLENQFHNFLLARGSVCMTGNITVREYSLIECVANRVEFVNGETQDSRLSRTDFQNLMVSTDSKAHDDTSASVWMHIICRD
jgi:hypothetical protein